MSGGPRAGLHLAVEYCAAVGKNQGTSPSFPGQGEDSRDRTLSIYSKRRAYKCVGIYMCLLILKESNRRNKNPEKLLAGREGTGGGNRRRSWASLSLTLFGRFNAGPCKCLTDYKARSVQTLKKKGSP